MNLDPFFDREYDYYRLEGGSLTGAWSYSAAELARTLSVCAGDRLEGLFLSLKSFTNAARNGGSIDATDAGGPVALVFGKRLLYLEIAAEGMIKTAFAEKEMLSFRKIHDLMPLDKTPFYGSLGEDFARSLLGSTVESIDVVPTDVVGGDVNGFDYERADAACAAKDMPNEIVFSFSCGKKLSLYGDLLENFRMRIE